MISKKRNLRIIDIIFWLIIIIQAIIEIVKSMMNGNINVDLINNVGILGIKEYTYMLIFIIFLFVFFMVVSLLKSFYLTIIYLGVRFAYKKYSKEKLDEIDFKNETYYREIISKYSPGVLSYIDDFSLNEKDIVATLMSLELKQKIKIVDKINIINENEENLDENEKYIFNNLKNNTLKNINISEFERKVVEDCLKSNLLEEKRETKKKTIKKIVINVCIFILIIVMFFNFPTFFNSVQNDGGISAILLLPIAFILFLTMIIFPFASIVYIKSYYIMNKLDPYVRNKEAKNINEKLEGLKNYIKNFSQLNEKQYNEMILWEEYLIYSVIFGQNTKIVKNITEKINNEL